MINFINDRTAEGESVTDELSTAIAASFFSEIAKFELGLTVTACFPNHQVPRLVTSNSVGAATCPRESDASLGSSEWRGKRLAAAKAVAQTAGRMIDLEILIESIAQDVAANCMSTSIKLNELRLPADGQMPTKRMGADMTNASAMRAIP